MKMNRRQMLSTLASAAIAPSIPVYAKNRRIERVGIQLFTLRKAMGLDAWATLAAVAAAGYAEVETAGTGNLSVSEFAAALKHTGLSAPAAHVPINLVMDNPDALLEQAQIIGYDYLVVPWLPPEMRTIEGYGQTIKALNKFGEQCQSEGLQLCYHNHDFEFESIDGEVVWDRLLRECDANLVQFELDLFWVTHAGADGAAYLAREPERYPLCHVKDRDA